MMMAVMSTFFFDQFQATFHGNFKTFLLSFVIGIGVTVAWLVLERVTIDRLIRTHRDMFSPLRYLSALIETSTPTLGMIVASQFLGPLYTLFTPAPFAYGLLSYCQC